MKREKTEKSPNIVISALLEGLIDLLEEQKPGIHEDGDPEALHDYRVALRKIRSLLSISKQIMPPSEREALKVDFAWVASATGAARDLDVHLAYIKKLASEELTFSAVTAVMERERRERYGALAEVFVSARYSDLISAARRAAAAAAAKEHADPKFEPFLLEQLRSVVKRILAESDFVFGTKDPESAHELRKSNKKLRAMMGFFRPYWKAGPLDKLQKPARNLHLRLGSLQDLSALEGWATAQREKDHAGHDAEFAYQLGFLSGIVKERKALEMEGLLEELPQYTEILRRKSSKI